MELDERVAVVESRVSALELRADVHSRQNIEHFEELGKKIDFLITSFNRYNWVARWTIRFLIGVAVVMGWIIDHVHLVRGWIRR